MLVRHHVEINEIELESHLLEKDDQVVCDGNQIQQALVALLVNAVEAMSGTQGGMLKVTVSADPAEVRVDVADNGSGIGADDLEHIFEPFFSTKEKESGVGLGLAVVYGIIQRHGGTVDVESNVGRGTVFHVAIPRHPPERDERHVEAHPY
jgi:two-component system NtrC family sensor kinase